MTADPMQRQVPHSIEAEQCLLGALMLSQAAWDRVDGRIRAADFYRKSHRVIFETLLDLQTQGQPCDAVTVAERMSERGQAGLVDNGAYLTMLANEVPSTSNAAGYAQIVRQKAMLRTLIETGTEMADAALNARGADPIDLVNAAQLRLIELMELGGGQHECTLKEALARATDDLMAAMESDSEIRGITSGFRDLDKHLSGFNRTDLIVIGARPAMGKTSLLLQMAMAAAKGGHAVGLISTEQPANQVAQRHQANEGRVSLAGLRAGRINDLDTERLMQATKRMMPYRYWLFDRSNPDIGEVVRVARKWRQQHGIAAIYVDYLQRIRGRGKDKTEQVGDVAVQLKNLARDLEIPVVALAQVNRDVEKRPNKRPSMGDLRNSGEIEQEADQILTLYRDEVYHEDTPDAGIAEISIEKNRHGYIGTIRTVWNGDFVRFDDLAYGPGGGGA